MPYRSLVSLLGFVLALSACTSSYAASPEDVVYGVDDRVEVYESTSDVHRAIAESAIAMQVSTAQIDASNPSDVRVLAMSTVGESERLCAGERFADQPNPGDCSGTLIDTRHLLTAGHCVARCSAASSWVLGYRYVAAGTLATLTTDDVYHCASIVTRRVTRAGGDYAVITLDREVVGHTPAGVERAPLAAGTSLTLMGHPDGMPMKIAGGAHVVGSDAATFTATVDAFAGNSGSGAFDDAGHVVGILDSGNQDYARNGSCFVVNVIDERSGQGESLTAVATAMAAFCATAEGATSPVCDGFVTDGGVPSVDAGTRAGDASAPGSDGSVAPAPASGGCGCTLARPPTRGLAWISLAGLVLAVGARRRRG